MHSLFSHIILSPQRIIIFYIETIVYNRKIPNVEYVQFLDFGLNLVQVIDMIVYDPFWRTLKNRGISTYKMINKLGYSSSTLYRLRHNKGISSRLIDDLCKLLDCRVEDILEYVPDPEPPEPPDAEKSP